VEAQRERGQNFWFGWRNDFHQCAERPAVDRLLVPAKDRAYRAPQKLTGPLKGGGGKWWEH